jgi:hypothetical protein
MNSIVFGDNLAYLGDFVVAQMQHIAQIEGIKTQLVENALDAWYRAMKRGRFTDFVNLNRPSAPIMCMIWSCSTSGATSTG